MPTNEDEFTGAESERQDEVDNAIYNLALNLAGLLDDEDDPVGDAVEKLPWDIEWIATIRDILEGVIVHDRKLMSEMEFYPYRVLEDPENIHRCFLCGAQMQIEPEKKYGQTWYFCENNHGRLSQAESYFIREKD